MNSCLFSTKTFLSFKKTHWADIMALMKVPPFWSQFHTKIFCILNEPPVNNDKHQTNRQTDWYSDRQTKKQRAKQTNRHWSWKLGSVLTRRGEEEKEARGDGVGEVRPIVLTGMLHYTSLYRHASLYNCMIVWIVKVSNILAQYMYLHSILVR